MLEINFRSTSTWIAIANIWFVIWAIRRRGEFDYDLDSTAKLLRWLTALACLCLAIEFPRVFKSTNVREGVGIVGIAFLA